MTLETLTNNKCIVDTFDRNFSFDVKHVSLAKRGDFVRHRDGSDVYTAASKMAIDLTEYFAVEKDQAAARAMMRALTLLGKLMARSLDVLRLEDGELVTFRIALTKRFLADLNELIGEYEKFPDAIRDGFLKDAFKMRDEVLEKIRKYRREQKRR